MLLGRRVGEGRGRGCGGGGEGGGARGGGGAVVEGGISKYGTVDSNRQNVPLPVETGTPSDRARRTRRRQCHPANIEPMQRMDKYTAHCERHGMQVIDRRI